MAVVLPRQSWEFCPLTEEELTSGTAVLVCTSLTDEEATARMNDTASGWRLSKTAARACSDDPATHRHMVFVRAT